MCACVCVCACACVCVYMCMCVCVCVCIVWPARLLSPSPDYHFEYLGGEGLAWAD